ncbi:MAG TPA: LytTR family DNA-binding domain-containing protein [Devosiaceae bacterium]|nr:LytTR family DNA-binding domain-containing protein [Devosiaceae bacterium]
MNGRPLQLALRELQATFSSPRALTAMAAVVLVLGLSGPFDTYAELVLAQRLVYWLAVVVLTYAIGRGTAAAAMALIGERIVSRPLRLLVQGFACGVPVTLVVLAVNAIAFGGEVGIHPLLLWVYCTLIATAVLLVTGTLLRETRPTVGAPDAPPSKPAPPAILERLPHARRGRLLALTVQDHYVEVITEHGRALVLMRLSDAIRETGATAGLQIHRSHWVALDAVSRVIKADGRVAVELTTGDRLPVSRGYLPAVREAGLVA